MNPLTIGFVTRPAGDGTSAQTDGVISAFLLFLVILGCGIALVTSHHLTEDRTALTRTHVNGFLIGLMALAMVVILVLWRSRALYVQTKPGTPLDLTVYGAARDRPSTRCLACLRNVQAILRQALPVIGLVAFYLVGTVYDVLLIVNRASCFSAASEYGLGVKFSVSILFHVVRLLFMGAEALFFVMFYNRAILQCLAARYGLLFVMAGTLTVWYDSTLFNQVPLDNTTVITPLPSMVNITEDYFSCIGDKQHKDSEILTRYLVPFNVQFFLLMVEFLASKFYAVKDPGRFEKMKEASRESRARDHPSSSESGSGSSHLRRRLTSETQGVSDQSNNIRRVQNSERLRENTRQELFLSLAKYVCRAVIVIILTVKFVLSFLAIGDSSIKANWVSWIYWIAVQVLTQVLCLVGYVLTGRFYRRRSPYNGIEMAVLLSSFGICLYSFLSMISQIVAASNGQNPYLLLTSYLLQTSFLFAASRVNRKLVVVSRSRDVSNTPSTAARDKFLGTCFKHITLYLALLNLVSWLYWTVNYTKFTLSREDWFPFERQVYGSRQWDVIFLVFKPVFLFYNFNAAVIFMMVFLKKES